jgi:tRNA N6-adenosine threonylcarbamoyltransferase
MTTILGIETSCDETAAAVVVDGVDVRSNLVASQIDLHAKYGGVVPEIASRAHIERLDGIVAEAMDVAGCGPNDLDAIAVTNRPGLVGALLIGVTAAKTLSWAWGKPLVAVDHIRAHAYSPAIGFGGNDPRPRSSIIDLPEEPRTSTRADDAKPTEPQASACANARTSTTTAGRESISPESTATKQRSLWPAIALVVSGGHTSLFRVKTPIDIDVLGATTDDAAGEAFDKVAAILGLAYPGGPVIERVARGGNPKAIDFPRTMLEPDSLDFSFSGIKTAVLYHVHGHGKTSGGLESLSPNDIADIAASFQQAVIDVLVRKTLLAVAQTGIDTVVLGGGVAANGALRSALEIECANRNLRFRAVERAYCTDNAAMIAALAHHQLQAGDTASLDLDAYPTGVLQR